MIWTNTNVLKLCCLFNMTGFTDLYWETRIMCVRIINFFISNPMPRTSVLPDFIMTSCITVEKGRLILWPEWLPPNLRFNFKTCLQDLCFILHTKKVTYAVMKCAILSDFLFCNTRLLILKTLQTLKKK